MASIRDLLGKIITEIQNNGDVINIVCSDRTNYQMLHVQDCCESVRVEDVEGELYDLVGSPILQAEEVTSAKAFEGKPEFAESFTWTFYKLATAKGYVTIRWLGQSNGYYSEGVDFIEV